MFYDQRRFVLQIFIIDKDWTVQEIYKIDSTSDNVISQNIGAFDPNRGFHLEQPLIWYRRQNLQGFHFRVGYLEESHLMVVLGSNGSYQGYLGNIFQQLKDTLNFSSTLIPDPTNRYGALINGTTFDGIVGMIQHGKIDFGLADLSITESRLEVIDILEPCWATAYRFDFIFCFLFDYNFLVDFSIPNRVMPPLH